jgi:hypothetical protein
MHTSWLKVPVYVSGYFLWLLVASGCATTNAYVENGHDKSDFHEIVPRSPQMPVLVEVDFRVNGVPRPAVNNEVYNEVVEVLRRSRVLRPVSANPGNKLEVVVDDTVDLDQARHRGFVTGITQGLVGSTIEDSYRFTYTLQSRNGTPQVGLYNHAMLTVSGENAPPGYGQPHSADEAFSVIVRQSVLEFLADIQSANRDDSVMLISDAPDSR